MLPTKGRTQRGPKAQALQHSQPCNGAQGNERTARVRLAVIADLDTNANGSMRQIGLLCCWHRVEVDVNDAIQVARYCMRHLS